MSLTLSLQCLKVKKRFVLTKFLNPCQNYMQNQQQTLLQSKRLWNNPKVFYSTKDNLGILVYKYTEFNIFRARAFASITAVSFLVMAEFQYFIRTKLKNTETEVSAEVEVKRENISYRVVPAYVFLSLAITIGTSLYCSRLIKRIYVRPGHKNLVFETYNLWTKSRVLNVPVGEATLKQGNKFHIDGFKFNFLTHEKGEIKNSRIFNVVFKKMP